MRKNSMNIMRIGTIGAIAGLALVPIMSPRTRKRISRTSRNVYFRMSDLVQDVRNRF